MKKSFLDLQKLHDEQNILYQKSLESLQKHLVTEQHRVVVLEEQIILLKRARFASSSEKLSQELAGQLGLFNEAEETLSLPEMEEAEQVARKIPKRKHFASYLPRVEVLVDLDEDKKLCTQGHALTCMGEETSEQLDIVPMQLKVIRTVRKKYACKVCQDQIITAPLPNKILPKSNAAPGLLAHIAVNKYSDGLPLYRQAKIFERCEIDLPRSTMAGWMVKLGQAVEPLINLMREDVQGSSYVQCDESPMQVLKEPEKSASSKSYMWVLARMQGLPIVLYEYDPSRSGQVPKRLLQDFSGFLQADGYAGYNEICSNTNVIRVGCWAHARRKFYEASKSSKKPGLSGKGLSFVQKLYKIEKQIQDLDPSARLKARQQQSQKVLQQFKTWLDQCSVPPKTALGQAISYTQSQWPALVRYIEDPMLRIDNNFIENKIRPFAIGRKNWLFANAPKGAQASANLYSLIETAKANNLNPFTYLEHLFTHLPNAHTLDQIEPLLPYKIKL